MIPTLATAPQDLQTLKLFLLDLTGLGKDALHVYAGLTVFIVVRLAWRWRGGWIIAWFAALALATTVEWLDMLAEGSIASLQPDTAHWHDIWNTMVWPTVLLLVGRWLHPKPKPKMLSDLSDESVHDSGKEPPSV
jgi:hypothetical protein